MSRQRIQLTDPAPVRYPLGGHGRRKATDYIVIHCTAGYTTATALWALEHRGLSVHYVTERNGMHTACLDVDERGAHAGGASWVDGGALNDRTIGIELVNFGPCENLPGVEPTADLRVYDPAEQGIQEVGPYGPEEAPGWRHEAGVITQTRQRLVQDPRTGELWAGYPEAQIDSLVDLLVLLLDRYKLGWHQVIGHDHAAPVSKNDPGPVFPWVSVYRELARRCANQTEIGAVKLIQGHLERLGFRPGVIDGIVGPRTIRAQRIAWDQLELADNPPIQRLPLHAHFDLEEAYEDAAVFAGVLASVHWSASPVNIGRQT